MGKTEAVVKIPVVETERLILRGHRVDDFADCAAMWGDPEVTRYIGGRPSTREEVWSRLLRYVGHWALLGFGYWVVTDKEGAFVGEVGFADFRREIEPSFDGRPEIGWVLMPRHHGRGFATEAVRGALGWLDASYGDRRSVCMIDLDNAASLRVAAKTGYKELVRTTYKGEPVVVFER